MKILSAIVLVILFSCSCGRGNQIKEEMERFYGQHVNLPLDSMLYMSDDENSTVHHGENSYKLLVYYDSTECSSCRLKTLYEWDALIDSVSSSECGLDFYFVFNVPQRRMDEVKTTLATYAKGLPVYLDTTGVFERMNPNLPRLSQMRTFMLDNKDTVVLVGNPVYNSRVEDMMWSMMRNHKQ